MNARYLEREGFGHLRADDRRGDAWRRSSTGSTRFHETLAGYEQDGNGEALAAIEPSAARPASTRAATAPAARREARRRQR